MAENSLNEQTVDGALDSADYIAAIEQLKATTVEKTKYDALKAENKQLIDALVNGSQIDLPSTATKPDIATLRNELLTIDSGMSNLEFIGKSLQLRDALIEAGEPDPFLPIGKRINPTPDDVAIAERVAEGYRHCIEVADGDSGIFTRELDRITKDVMPMYGRRK